MSEMTNFTQPDIAPSHFIAFLEFLDKHAGIKGLRAEACAHMNLAAGNKVLDLGCGIGGATFAIADITGPTGLAAGLDISSAMIDVATRRANGRPGLEFRVGDARAIPYPEGFFDAARSERVFLYLPDRLAAIQEMKRVLKPGGRLCLMDTEIDSTAIFSRNLALTRKMTSTVAASIPNPNSARELPALVKQAGLRNIQTETFALSTPYEFFLRAMVGSLTKAAGNQVLTLGEVDEFLAEQAALHAAGDFFQAWLYVVVTATK